MAQEAQDDLRITDQFDFEAFWAEYGKRITWAAAVIVAITLIVLYRQHQSSQQMELAADSLDRAQDATSLEGVARDFPTSPVAADANSTFTFMARRFSASYGFILLHDPRIVENKDLYLG